jgi:hypothetical protein
MVKTFGAKGISGSKCMWPIKGYLLIAPSLQQFKILPNRKTKTPIRKNTHLTWSGCATTYISCSI